MLPCAKATSYLPKWLIKQIQLIANAKIMLYTSASQKQTLWFNHKFIWRLLRMFSTQIWEKVDCKMKSRFLVNIWKMLAWLISCEIKNEWMNLPLRACSPFSHTQPFPWHTARAWQDTHTTNNEIVGWPSPHSFLGLKWRPCGCWLMVLHFRFCMQW